MRGAFVLPIVALLLGGALAPFQGAFAAPLGSAFTDVPSRFHTRELTAGSKALGDICLSRDVMPDGTVCNPAFAGEIKEGSLLARAYVGSGFEAVSTANQLIYEPVDREFLNHLFDEGRVTAVDAQLGLVFSAKSFSASFSPYRVQYLSEIHNPNFPVVSLHAAIERSLVFGTGFELPVLPSSAGRLSVGGRLRLLERSFIHESFSFLEAATEGVDELIPVQRQKAVLLDPSVGWVLDTSAWKPRASISAVNLGKVWPKNDLYPDRPDLGLGLGISPRIGFGELRLGLDAVDLIHGETFLSRLRLGSSYRLGMMEIMTGWNTQSTTAGLQFGLKMLQASIVYEFFRSGMQGGAAETRISTELSVRI